jgi:hypothetical protein
MCVCLQLLGRQAEELMTSELPHSAVLLHADHSGRAVEGMTVFVRSNAGIVGANPTQGMDICSCLFCVCIDLCAGSGLATG